MQQLISILKSKGYQVYDKPYQLNIIGVRGSESTSNRFDDKLYVLFKNDKNRWEKYSYSITTDPGTYWLKNPLQVDGTAILKQGQYVNAYQLGLHRGQYKALVQRKPVTVIRDYDRNAVLDFNNGRESTGLYGINIHRASIHGVTKTVGKWSAGCQVFERNEDFIHFMSLCEKHRTHHGNQFTYTLIDFRAIKRMGIRYVAYGAIGVTTLISLLYIGIKEYTKRKKRRLIKNK
jgi:hypothetical protein